MSRRMTEDLCSMLSRIRRKAVSLSAYEYRGIESRVESVSLYNFSLNVVHDT